METITVEIVLEETKTGYSAYSPDVPGCVTVGSTKEETEKNMAEALEFHFEGMLEAGCELPRSRSVGGKNTVTVKI